LSQQVASGFLLFAFFPFYAVLLDYYYMNIEQNNPLPPSSEKAPSGKELSEQDFSFTADDVIKELRHNKIEYIGTGLSDFQSQPLLFDANDQPIVMSDWELEVVKSINEAPGAIHSPEQVAELPRFLDKTEAYVKRSEEIDMNMFRLSLDFARLCPEPGKFDEEMMGKYVKALGLIKAHGQEPMLAIHHWTMPKYLLKTNEKTGEIEAGGWENPDVAKHFRFYVDNVVRFLGDEDKIKKVLDEEGFNKNDQDKFLAEGLAKYFLTINEPSTFMMDTYIAGVFPPFKKANFGLVKKVTQELVNAHDITLNELKSGKLKLNAETPKVGLAHNWTYFDGLLGKILQKQINEKLTKKFEGDGTETDFLALQYYCRVTLPSLSRPITSHKAADKQYSDHEQFGDIYPAGIYENLKAMNTMYPNKEIFITEFGFSDARDKKRPYWMLETMRYVLEAKKIGVPIKGMLAWSLVNNFEWDRGMEQKFGLFSEKQLQEPLQKSSSGITSWEAWQTVAQAIAQPTAENIQKLQASYEKTKLQYNNAGY
jgi:beta-glucosidase